MATPETETILGIETSDGQPRDVILSYISEVNPLMFSLNSIGAHWLSITHDGRPNQLYYSYDGLIGDHEGSGGGPLIGEQHRLDIEIFGAGPEDLEFNTDNDGIDLELEEGLFWVPGKEGGREFESLLLVPLFDVPHQTGRMAVYMTRELRLPSLSSIEA